MKEPENANNYRIRNQRPVQGQNVGDNNMIIQHFYDSPTQKKSSPPDPVHQKQTRKKKIALFVSVLLLVIVSSSILSILFYANNIGHASTNQGHTTPTVDSQATFEKQTAITQAKTQKTATAIVQSTETAVAQQTAIVQSTETALAQQTVNPYGGQLQISDPMKRPGSLFGWTTGNDQNDDKCNFTDGAYHVFGYCDSGSVIPSRFAFSITFRLNKNFCVETDVNWSIDFGLLPRNIYAVICQNGFFNLDGVQSIIPANVILNGLGELNTIGLIVDGTHYILYLNSKKVFSISETNQPPSFSTMELVSYINTSNNADLDNGNYATIAFTDARLWDL